LRAGLRSRPAREISGDVYDFFEQAQNQTLIAFGDVSGKGAAAALYGALVSGLLRTLAPTLLRPSELIQALNESLLERKVDAQYATLVVAVWEPANRRLLFANAGAEPPLVCRAGEILKPRVEGVPIGLLEGREYEEVEFALEPGDTVLFYSDGVEDQLNADDEEYSRARLMRLLKKHSQDPPQQIADAIFESLDQFRGRVQITDDQTVVALNVP